MNIDRSAPVFYVQARANGVGAEGVRVSLSERIISLKFDDNERTHDKLNLTVDNYDLSLHDDPAFKKGMLLEVAWGYLGAMAPTRIVVVTKITGSLVLNVEARAQSALMNTRTRSRTFENVSRSEVVRRIAAEYGFTGDAVDIEETSVTRTQLTQGRLTDAQFIARLATQEGFQWYVDWSGFHFHRRRVGVPPVRTLRYFTSQTGDVMTFNVENDITAKPGRTRARGRNPLERSDIDDTADDETDSSREVLAPVRDLIDPEDGSTRVVEGRLAGEETVPTTAPDSATAAREARGRFRRTQQAAVKMTMTIVGDPNMLAKTVVRVEGVGARLSQAYYVRKVVSSLSKSGYTCDLELISDGHGGHSTTSRVAHGLELVDGGPATRASPNTTPGPTTEAGAATEGEELMQVDQINEETGETVTQYRDARTPRGGQ